MMESRQIQSILPHRYPFLLVDRILEIEPGKRGIGIKNLTSGEWFFHGHSSYPPTLLLESLAQVGGIVLGSKAREENPQNEFIGLFAGVSDFQFQRCPVMGEVITLKVVVTQSLASLYRFAAEVFVDGEKIASGQILLSFGQNPSRQPGRRPAGKK
jgi:3-hydroxyacyl-[acyl-carrier-protein] dehydratase